MQLSYRACWGSIPTDSLSNVSKLRNTTAIITMRQRPQTYVLGFDSPSLANVLKCTKTEEGNNHNHYDGVLLRT